MCKPPGRSSWTSVHSIPHTFGFPVPTVARRTAFPSMEGKGDKMWKRKGKVLNSRWSDTKGLLLKTGYVGFWFLKQDIHQYQGGFNCLGTCRGRVCFKGRRTEKIKENYPRVSQGFKESSSEPTYEKDDVDPSS